MVIVVDRVPKMLRKARRPYRLLDKERYTLTQSILLESLELVAYKRPMPQGERGDVMVTAPTYYYGGSEGGAADDL